MRVKLPPLSAKAALLLLAMPELLHLLLFKYYPMLGNVIAFQNYDLFKGISGSPWMGLEHFQRMLSHSEFLKILGNTAVISFYQLLFGFPAPLLLALLVNEVRLVLFKRFTQTLLYLPHFLSWIIVGGLFTELLSPDGLVNAVFGRLFGWMPTYYLTEPGYFRGILVSVGVWKEVGWGMIVYLAVLTGINPSLYEAAMIDGAGRWKRMVYVTLPSLLPAIVILLLLRIGHMLDHNVEQMLVFLNPLVRGVGEVIDTYVYRVGLQGAQYSYSTAIGLFKSAIGLLLVVFVNRLSKRVTGESIY